MNLLGTLCRFWDRFWKALVEIRTNPLSFGVCRIINTSLFFIENLFFLFFATYFDPENRQIIFTFTSPYSYGWNRLCLYCSKPVSFASRRTSSVRTSDLHFHPSPGFFEICFLLWSTTWIVTKLFSHSLHHTHMTGTACLSTAQNWSHLPLGVLLASERVIYISLISRIFFRFVLLLWE